MSQWFKQRRQEFIAATLRQFGQVRRADLVREFDISVPQASNDIAEFLSASPANVRYDVSAKAYIMEQPE
jgi:DeoR/GlpR family transcriptional regulator of sugar metabolism